MNNIIKRKWNQNSMVIIEDMQGMAFQAESGGHTFQISGIDGEGNAVALSGTPAGVMLRADGQDVTLTCSASEGVISATLPANAYSVPGRFGLTIFLTSDGQKTAIYAAVGTVGKTSSGTVAPPAGSDVVDLVNAIAAAVATIPASYTDLMASVAPTYSSSGLYAVGSYAWYNGKLYRCTTAITSGETWTSGHWTLANLGSDLVDLKSAVNGKSILKFELGGISSGADTTSTKYVRSLFYFSQAGGTVRIAPVDFDVYNLDIYFYTSPNVSDYVNSVHIGNYVTTQNPYTYTIPTTGYFRIRASKQNTQTLTDEEVAKFSQWFTLTSLIGSQMLENRITALEDEADVFAEKADMAIESKILPCEVGGINAGKSTSSGKYVRVKYAFATKGSKLIFAPTNISVYNMALYFYTSPDEDTYTTSQNVGQVLAGTTYTYIFQTDTWFRLRASKQDTPVLTEEEIAEISTYFTLETISTNFELPNTNYYLIGKAQAMLAEHQRLLDSFTFPDSWSDKTEEIHKAIGKGFAFGIQTDTHKSLYTKDTGNSTAYAMDANDFTPMKMFTNYVGLDFIANLGDIIRGQGYDTYEEMQKSFTEIVYRYAENVACPVLFAVGNHDDAALGTVEGESPTLNEVILPSEQYAIMMKPVINTCYENIAHSKELYYYKDFDDVRVIVLNSRDIAYQAFGQSDIHINHHKIGTEQLAWLSNVALNTDKQVLVLCHVPLVNDLYSTSTFDGRDEAYQALVDFKQNGGTVIGVMCGHTHEANTAEVSGIRNIVFKNGANFAEIVIVDTENKTISTKMVGDYGTLTDRGPFSYT